MATLNSIQELTRQDMQKLQLAILRDIDAFCRENGLRYYLFAGSLIGAVRHKGFIPWDDDIDICMMRSDYDRFFQEFNRAIIPNRKAICFESEKDYYSAAGKVIDTRTVLIEEVNQRYQIGVYVDVFPLDSLPTDEKAIRSLNRKIRVYRDMALLKTVKAVPGRAWHKNMVLRISETLLKPVPMPFILKRIASLAKTYQHDPNCTRVADISVFTYGLREVHLLSEFAETTDLEFEGERFSAPAGYKSVLTRMYGDYMKLPPPEKRVTHHANTAFWKGATTEL